MKKINLGPMGWISALLCAVLLASCGGGSTASSTSAPPVVPEVTPAQSEVKGTITHDITITSAKIGAIYPTQIYVPPDYASTSDMLPIIYALDGEGIADTGEPRFPMMVKLLEKNGVRAILVGIGNYSRRAPDYLMPGASKYYEFLTQELIPVVEARYRVDTARRTLDGHSFGGLFVILALSMDRPNPRFFTNFIAQDPSMWVTPEISAEMEQTMFVASKGSLPNTTLIVSSSLYGNDSSVGPWHEKIAARNYAGLSLTRLPAYPVSHDAMFSPSFIASISLVLPHN